MKTLIFIAALLSACITARAQTWDEWFRQKKTQKKYLVQQIAALKVYIDYLKKGNQIIKDGTGLISDIKGGDLKLHSDRFSGLKYVNPAISKNSKAKAIIGMHEDILASQLSTTRKTKESRQFTDGELLALKKRFKDLATEAEKDIDELLLVITDGKLEMADDQRIKAIDRLYRRMQDKYLAQKILSSNALALAQARLQGTKDATIFKSLHGLEP